MNNRFGALALAGAVLVIFACQEPLSPDLPTGPSMVVHTALFPASCQDVVDLGLSTGDGDYTIFPNGQTFTVFCFDMAGTPREYLTLVNTGFPKNYSQYTPSARQGSLVRTTYTRVRINPQTLDVDIGDKTFSSSFGSLSHGSFQVKSMPYGIAEACVSGRNPAGSANIDLRGTPFKVADTFVTQGNASAGSVNFSAGDQVVKLTGGGFCGWTKMSGAKFNPHTTGVGAFVLDLAYTGPINRPPVVATDTDPVAVDEGQTANNTGTVSDADDDAVKLMASVGTVTNNNDGTWSWSFGTTDGPAESQTVTIDADDGRAVAQTTFTLTVNNVAPTVTSVTVPGAPVAITEQPVSASGTFTDPAGTADEPYTCTVDYGDGSGPQAGTVAGTTCIGPDQTYAESDSYTVTVAVTDKDGGTGSAKSGTPIVIYDPAAVLVIDEESIGKDAEPNFFSEADVNEPIADIGVRAQLPFFAANVGSKITLHTGEVGDEGWFALKTIPGSWDAAGPTSDGLRNYIEAGPGLGSGGDREALLDKIPDVTPLRATGLGQLKGHPVCAVVYKSDVSINYDPLDGSLKGDNLGTVAFEVISVTQLTGFSSSSLPKVEIEILDADVVCGRELTLFTEATEPTSSSEACIAPPSGLVSWWPGDGDATDIVGANNGVVNGATFATGQVGQAFTFDGVNDHVKVNGSPSLQLTGDFTIDAWVRPNPGYGQQEAGHIDIVGRWGPGGTGRAAWLLAVNNQGKVILFTHNGTTTNLLTSSSTIPVNAFSHIAGVRDGAAFKVFINGVLKGTANLVAPQVSTFNVFIGQEDDECTGCNGGNNFSGLIDELEIFNRALSASEIADIFNAGSEGKCK